MSTPLPPWTTRNSFQKEPHQRVVDRVNELHNITPPAGGEVLRTPFGTGVTPPPPLKTGTDYSVYVQSFHADAGKYTGFCFRTLPRGSLGAADPTTGTPCHIINDDEWYFVSGSVYANSPTHWAFLPCYSVGRFDGEYSTDTPPKPIIHVSGLPCNYDLATVSPFFTGQTWLRHGPNVGAAISAGTTAQLGDTHVRIKVAVSEDPTTKANIYRFFTFDKGGRLVALSAEGV